MSCENSFSFATGNSDNSQAMNKPKLRIFVLLKRTLKITMGVYYFPWFSREWEQGHHSPSTTDLKLFAIGILFVVVYGGNKLF